MPVFDYRFDVPASLEEVRAYHHDTAALKRLTPPPVIVQLHDIEPMAEGSISRFTLWMGPLPIRWTAVHRNVDPNGFTDIQTDGPAKKWEHTHTFTAKSENLTEVHEHIEYEHLPGSRGWLTRVLFSPLNLNSMFAYRRWRTRRDLARRGT